MRLFAHEDVLADLRLAFARDPETNAFYTLQLATFVPLPRPTIRYSKFRLGNFDKESSKAGSDEDKIESSQNSARSRKPLQREKTLSVRANRRLVKLERPSTYLCLEKRWTRRGTKRWTQVLFGAFWDGPVYDQPAFCDENAS